MSATFTAMLIITLKSDLCAASGEGFSEGIDVDVVYDFHGLPYVPARRIKGCLRESARLIGADAPELFGERGSRSQPPLRIGDALLPHTDELAHMLDAGGYSAQEVLAVYAYQRAQTALDNEGIADDHTLRVARVVKHHDPLDSSKELAFEAPVTLTVTDEARAEELRRALGNACAATRNIGHGRNHGLGAVRCTLKWDEKTSDEPRRWKLYRATMLTEGMRRLWYAVKLDAPVMVPQANGNETCAYIPGTSVLGCFAGKLADSERFDALFLEGKVHFSPLYPMDAAGNRCMPASSLVVKVKGGADDGKYRSAVAANIQQGERALPVEDGFLDASFRPVEQQLETVYHHSTGNDATLYTQKVLCAGQELAGFIDCPEGLLADIQSVLDNGELSFGRSKTAQYARCPLVEWRGSEQEDGTLAAEAGRTYAWVLDSDVLLLDEMGRPSCSMEQLISAIEESAGIGGDAHVEIDRNLSRLRRKTIAGYNAKWNHKKPHVRVIAAGSCIVFTAAAGTALLRETTVGERQGEGFGRVLVIDASAIAETMSDGEGHGKQVAHKVSGGTLGPSAEGSSYDPTKDEHAKPLKDKLDAEQLSNLLRSKGVKFASDHEETLTKLNAAFVGRLALMAAESKNWNDFEKRVQSIKSEDKCKATEGLFKKLRGELTDAGLSSADWQELQECILVVTTVAKRRLTAARKRSGKGAGNGEVDA